MIRDIKTLIATLALGLGFAGTATALPMVGTIMGAEGQDSALSLVHCGANPQGCGNYLMIDPGQTFEFDVLDNLFIYTNTPVSFSLNNGAATLEMLELFVRIDHDEPDMFRYGFMAYSLHGDLNGNAAVDYSKFWFENINMGPYNSLNFDGANFDAFMWGGDDRYSTITGGNPNGLGIDFAFSAESVPEPGTLLLLGLGLAGMAVRRRKI